MFYSNSNIDNLYIYIYIYLKQKTETNIKKIKNKNASNLIQLSSLINEFYVEFFYIVIINKISIQHMRIFVCI